MAGGSQNCSFGFPSLYRDFPGDMRQQGQSWYFEVLFSVAKVGLVVSKINRLSTEYIVWHKIKDCLSDAFPVCLEGLSKHNKTLRCVPSLRNTYYACCYPYIGLGEPVFSFLAQKVFLRPPQKPVGQLIAVIHMQILIRATWLLFSKYFSTNILVLLSTNKLLLLKTPLQPVKV